MKIINNHIPRTIFGIKYTYKDEDITEFNCIDYYTNINKRDKIILKISNDKRYSDIKKLKWLIKPNEED